MAEDGGASGAGGGGDVAGAVVPGLPGEEGEGGGFFGFGGEARGVGGGKAAIEGREAVAELGEEGGVACASAGDDEVDGAVVREGQDPAADGVGDAFDGEGGGGSDGVCR